MKPSYLSACLGLVLSFEVQAHGMAPASGWQVNFFTHANSIQREEGTTKREEFTLGESTLFVATNLGNRWSALTEITYQPKLYRDDTVKVERLQLRYELTDEQYFVIGKVHTPMNYWNDTYHHGRVFFPTIYRPLAFERFIPIHDIGLRWGGRGIGDKDMFFDLVVGSGITAESEHEFFGNGMNSATASFGFYPTQDWSVQVGYYSDTLIDRETLPGHKAHAMPMPANQAEDLDYELFAFSSQFENDNYRALTEISMNRTADSDWNYSIFQYGAYKVTPDLSLYGYYDITSVEDGGVHFAPGEEIRAGLGLSYFFTTMGVVKFEFIEHENDILPDSKDGLELRMQVAVGF